MLNKKGGRQRGVSLIEVLVALFILSVVGVAILAGSYVNVKSTEVSRETIRAEGLAKYELEYVKGCASSNWITNEWIYTLSGGPQVVGANTPWESAHAILPGYEGYSVTVSSKLLSGEPYSNNTDIQKVTASVSYKGSAVSPMLSIDTYIVKTQ